MSGKGRLVEKLIFREMRDEEYESCSFVQCDFSDADLKGIAFTDCHFDGCKFSMSQVAHTAFREAHFLDCKLTGIHFDECNPFLFSVSFEQCVLQYCSFYRLGMKKAVFRRCILLESDFTETDLGGAVFDHCDLSGTVFDRTILEQADLRTASHYSINPQTNHIRKARFTHEGVSGLLDQYDIIIE